MDLQPTVDSLKRLHRSSKDGAYGFARCSELTRDAGLKHFFARRAAECARAAADLQRMILQRDGTIENTDVAFGAMHRGWLALRSRVAADGERALVEQRLLGQDAAAQCYGEMLALPLPALLRMALEQQHEGVLRNRDRLRALRATQRLMLAPQG